MVKICFSQHLGVFVQLLVCLKGIAQVNSVSRNWTHVQKTGQAEHLAQNEKGILKMKVSCCGPTSVRAKHN